MIQRWIRFEDRLPTKTDMEQVHILFCSPRWATYQRGLYTHYPDESLRERLAWYNTEVDKFHDWETMLPTHWMLSPPMPTNTKFQVGEKVLCGMDKGTVKEIEIREHGDSDYIIEDHWGNTSLEEESFLEKIKRE